MNTPDADIWSSLPTTHEAPQPSEPGAPQDLRERYRRFQRYNALRLKLVRQRLPERCREVFDVLPLLIHQPLTGAPGGEVDGGSPMGIVNFEPTRSMRAAAERLFPGVTLRSWASLHRPAILSLLAMGSAGTIAQTGASDLDLWLIVEERCTSGAEWIALRQRLEAIERWAATNGLEVHFFPLSAEQVRRCDFGRIERESAGSALKSMLVEEFYRTHLLIQGQAPLWWLADPHCSGRDYQSLDAMLKWERGLDTGGFLDLGQPRPIPADEFLGACLWQMVKSLRRPFKSLLKMTLVARHLDQDEPPLLCELLKERILSSEELGPLDTDPYLFLVDTLVAEHDQRGDPATGRMLRQSFYLQLLAGSGRSALAAAGGEALKRLAEHWAWSPFDVQHLERFGRWKLTTIDKLGRRIQIYLEGILDRLWQRIRDTCRHAIHREDIELIDRKIRGSRGQHPDQIDLLFTGYYPGSLVQPKLVFTHRPGGWVVASRASAEQLVQAMPHLDDALAFSAVNGLYGKRTGVQVKGPDAPSPSVARMRLARMAREFAGARPEEVSVTEFGHAVRPARLLVEVFTVQPSPIGPGGTQEVSEHWDLLEYGRQGRCLIERISIWTVTNWGTVVRQAFSGPAGVVDAMVHLLAQRAINSDATIRFVQGDGTGGSRSGSRRLEMLFEAVASALEPDGDRRGCLFLARPGGFSHLITREADGPVALGPLTEAALLDVLSSYQPSGKRLVVDPDAVQLMHLGEALRRTAPGKAAVFLFPSAAQRGWVAIDRVGSVFPIASSSGGQLKDLLAECALALHGWTDAAVRILERFSDGGWEERTVGLPAVAPDVVAVGDLETDGGLGFVVRGFEKPRADNLEQAVTWLLSKWGPGLERPPRLALGEVRRAGFALDLMTRLRVHRRLADELTDAFEAQLKKARSQERSVRNRS